MDVDVQLAMPKSLEESGEVALKRPSNEVGFGEDALREAAVNPIRRVRRSVQEGHHRPIHVRQPEMDVCLGHSDDVFDIQPELELLQVDRRDPARYLVNAGRLAIA